jgi:acyl-CoA reductase-like NAD-dependent aldehyde dehydrogenase
MLPESFPYYLANRACAANTDLPVRDKFTQEIATHVALADAAVVKQAVAAAAAAAEPMRRLSSHERQSVLRHCHQRLEPRREELARVLCVEAGKPIRDARNEVGRMLDTFRIAAEESVRIHGEVLPLDATPRAKGYTGMWKRVPVGPCGFITPFNFPLNLVAHKIAPALAAGCPFVLKPASFTPVSALLIGEALAETSLPEGAFSILPCSARDSSPLVEDERIKLLSFTGSPEVGWDLKARAGRKKVVLELGGNAAVIVDHDADVEDAASRIVVGAFAQSGQSCISVQRILAHESLYERLRERLVERARDLKTGDPSDEQTSLGPLIDEAAIRRLEEWIASAVGRGAKLLCGGKSSGLLMEATLLEEVPKDEPLCAKEAFGPVAVLSRFRDFDAALAEVNDSAFGLQAGVFTRDLYRAQRAWDSLEVGGVIIGDTPTWRSDAMPYGGMKGSGLGREGVRFALEEMTEIRMLVIRTP